MSDTTEKEPTPSPDSTSLTSYARILFGVPVAIILLILVGKSLFSAVDMSDDFSEDDYLNGGANVSLDRSYGGSGNTASSNSGSAPAQTIEQKLDTVAAQAGISTQQMPTLTVPELKVPELPPLQAPELPPLPELETPGAQNLMSEAELLEKAQQLLDETTSK